MSDRTSCPIAADSLQRLAEFAEQADVEARWPEESWQLVRQAGVLSWSLPRELGGLGWSAAELLQGYETLSGACLTTAFILSQREAAVRRILQHGNATQQKRWLPGLASGSLMATVGLSQLTTSRQYGPPSLVATSDGTDHLRLQGLSPWVTAADHADEIVLGATLPDGRQLLALVPREVEGLTIDPPLALSALAGSRTAAVHCEGVRIESERVLVGPAAQVLATGRGGVGGLETSCLAVGLGGAAVDHLCQEATSRPDVAAVADTFENARRALRQRLLALTEVEAVPAQVVALRVDCTMFALRATQAALVVAKGTGFVSPHPVQRWARQALFFLVWSCPRPAAEGIMAELMPGLGILPVRA